MGEGERKMKKVLQFITAFAVAGIIIFCLALFITIGIIGVLFSVLTQMFAVIFGFLYQVVRDLVSIVKKLRKK